MDTQPNIFTTRRAMIRLTYEGKGLPAQASWPFTKLEVNSQKLTLKLFLTSVTLLPSEVALIEEYRQSFTYGHFANEHGFRVQLNALAGPQRARPITSVDIAYRGNDFESLASALQAAGFTVKRTLNS